MAAHHVNVEGTLNLLEFAAHETESHGRPVVFVYPSSIAAYGLPDLDTRSTAGCVREDDWNKPITMYGCNKLYADTWTLLLEPLQAAPGDEGAQK